jgi:hypothetical protein
MNGQDAISWKTFEQKCVSRRNLIRGAAGTALGVGQLRPKLVYASDDDGESQQTRCISPNPIPGGVTALNSKRRAEGKP